MANFSGANLSSVFPLAAPPWGRTAGVATPSHATDEGDTAEQTAPFSAAFTAAGAAPTVPAATNYSGNFYDGSPGLDWFDAIHVLPRGMPNVPFGNIVTQVESDFVVHSAFRQPVILSALTNPGSPSISVPNLPSLPFTLASHSTLYNYGASTAFTPTEQVVRADDDGPANFDVTLAFVFAPGGSATLRVTGSRITLFDGLPEHPFDETLTWGTRILPKQSGAEQRISARKQPRQGWEYTYRLDGLNRRILHTAIYDWLRRQFALPVWEDSLAVTAAVSSGSATVSTSATASVDIRVGGLAIVYTDSRTFDVLTVQSVAANSVTFTSNLANSHAIGASVVPSRLARILGPVRGRRYQTSVDDISIRWESVDNDTGALTGDTSPYSTYGSRVLLDDPNCLDADTSPFQMQQRGLALDAGTGRVYFTPIWTRGKRTSRKVFTCRSRADLTQVKRLLIALRGPQVAFWLPTFFIDMVATQALGAASTDLVIENMGYTRFVQSRAPKAAIRVVFNDGTASIIRSISSALETSGTEETLTVDSVWGVDKATTTISRIEYLELVRLSGESVRIRHETDGFSQVAFAVTEVFDTP